MTSRSPRNPMTDWMIALAAVAVTATTWILLVHVVAPAY